MAEQAKAGSAAKAITPAKLKEYREQAASADPQVREYMEELAAAVSAYHKAADKGEPAAVLSPALQKALDPALPWPEQFNAYAAVFDRIDPVNAKPLRTAAHHLLWYANELANVGRNPATL
jgi:hypothetical protein